MITNFIKKATTIIGKTLPRYAFLLLALMLSISLVRNIVRISSANDKIMAARKKVEELEVQNKKLKEEVENVESDFFAQKTARDKLGLAKQGETVIVLPDEATLKKIAPGHKEGEETLPDPHWKKWLDLFI